MKFYQEFTASGTFSVPATGKYCVIAVGAGSSGYLVQSSVVSGIGGFAGEMKMNVFDLTAGQNIAVTIGNGGARPTTNSFNPGNSTSFGALLTALGGTITDDIKYMQGNVVGGSDRPPNTPGGNGGYNRVQYGGMGARETALVVTINDVPYVLNNTMSQPTGNGGAIGATGEGYGAGGAGQGGVGRSGIVVIYRM